MPTDEWGIKVTSPKLQPKQTYNAWAEIMAQLIFSYKRIIQKKESLRNEDIRIVNFFGYDNSYFYALVHVVLLAHIENGKWLPYSTVINEFYNLDHSKFSTSANHVIWGDDFAKKYPVDAIRLYAAYNSPSFQKTNFNEQDFIHVIENNVNKIWGRISTNWNNLIQKIDLTSNFFLDQKELEKPIYIRDQILKKYSLNDFDIRQSSENILSLLNYIDNLLVNEKGDFSTVAKYLLVFTQSLWPIAPTVSESIYFLLTGKTQMSLDFPQEIQINQLPDVFFDMAAES